MTILVTGAAVFIGFKLMLMLAERGDDMVGLDYINDYYDVSLKYGCLWGNGFRLTISPRRNSCRCSRGGACARRTPIPPNSKPSVAISLTGACMKASLNS